MSALHTKVPREMTRGMIVQVSSRAMEPWMGGGSSPGPRRRKRTANTTTRPAIRIEKKALIPMRKKYSASTRAAKEEACGGKRGKPENMSGRGVSPAQAEDHGPDGPEGQHRGHAQKGHDRLAVAPELRIVVVAVQEQAVHRREDPALRGFDDREAQVLGRVLHAVEVAGQPAVGGEDHDPARMRILL